ncbi:MAG: NUDIX hydrolase [Candidatus Woesearchaeota archaeon]
MKRISLVVIGVIKKNNKFLLTKRRSSKTKWNKWQFPGGTIEFGETLKEALLREIKEEINCKVQIITKKPLTLELILPRDNFHGIFFVFLCQLKNQNCSIKINSEASDYGWFSLNEIKKLDTLEEVPKIIDWLKTL